MIAGVFMTNEVVQKPSVLVMMATYNGEKYVAEQIDSILAQDGVDVTLFISDDGSSDGTPLICAHYAQNAPNVHFAVNENNKGLARNFMDMLYGTDATSFDYFAFSDQDDYWMSNKLGKAIEAIDSTGEGPHLYYSDVCNVDEQLNGGSREYGAFAPYANSLGLLLTVNWASGCTMVFNSAFASALQQYVPRDWPRIHDGWVHLVARVLNAQVPDLDHAYIKRRISGQNQVGERGLNRLSGKRMKIMAKSLLVPSEHGLTEAAALLLDGYSGSMSAEDKELISRFVDGRHSIVRRLGMMFDPAFAQPFPLENVIFKGKMLLNIY